MSQSLSRQRVAGLVFGGLVLLLLLSAPPRKPAAPPRGKPAGPGALFLLWKRDFPIDWQLLRDGSGKVLTRELVAQIRRTYAFGYLPAPRADAFYALTRPIEARDVDPPGLDEYYVGIVRDPLERFTDIRELPMLTLEHIERLETSASSARPPSFELRIVPERSAFGLGFTKQGG